MIERPHFVALPDGWAISVWDEERQAWIVGRERFEYRESAGAYSAMQDAVGTTTSKTRAGSSPPRS